MPSVGGVAFCISLSSYFSVLALYLSDPALSAEVSLSNGEGGGEEKDVKADGEDSSQEGFPLLKRDFLLSPLPIAQN